MSERENRGPDEDYELVARCQKGDLDAFESLVMKHQGKMLNIAFRMAGNYEDACEIVQDAFLSAYRGIGSFENRSRFSTWLYTIVINTSRNRLRQISSAARHEEFSLDDASATGSSSMHSFLASDCPSPAEQIGKRELQEKVQECINRLEAEFREVLVLRDIQGFSYDEISGMLNIVQGTVKSRLFRARENMKNCLRKVLGG